MSAAFKFEVDAPVLVENRPRYVRFARTCTAPVAHPPGGTVDPHHDRVEDRTRIRNARRSVGPGPRPCKLRPVVCTHPQYSLILAGELEWRGAGGKGAACAELA